MPSKPPMKNIRPAIFSLSLLVLSFATGAQTTRGSVQGTLFDSSLTKPLAGASVSVMSLPDSIVVKVTLSDAQGLFAAANLPFGDYLLQASFSGLETLEKPFTLDASQPLFNAGDLVIKPPPKLMEGIVIKTSPITINGDTTDIKVSQFKTIPNATTEDLLKKLPGVEVEKDGTVKTQGEKVTRILVDGKRFFGKDPKMATRNLPADMIERIQLIDAKSDQSEFSGFDDGERVQTINIITKKDKKNGLFGKGSAAAGTEGRSAAAVSANLFKNNRQLSVVAQANNTNSQEFTVQDFLGTMGSGANNNRRGAAGAPVQAGIATTRAAGVNYNEQLGDRTQMNASYSFDNIRFDQDRSRIRETFFANDSSLFNSAQTAAANNNKNHRLNLEFNHSFDSFNTLLIRPELNLQQTDNFTETASFTTRGKTVTLNRVNNFIHSYNSGHDFSNSVLYRHRFAKPGRSFSINLTQRANSNDWNRDNVAYTTRPSGRVDTLDQVSGNDRGGRSLGANLSVTERLSARAQLELTYAYNNTVNHADQKTFRRNKATGNYDIEVDNLTNRFENTNTSHRTGLNYRLQASPALNLSAGLAVQRASLESYNITKERHIQQAFTNLFPNVQLTYRENRRKNLRVSYRGATRQPTVMQLQDVLDNSQVLHIRSGNPELKQEFSNDLTIRYNTFNTTSLKQFSVNINGSLVRNKIANTHFINATSDSVLVDGFKIGPGVQYSKFRNLNGSFDFGGSVNYSFPVTKSSGNFLQLGTRLHFDREVNLINNQMSNTDNYLLAGTVKLTLNLKERFDLNFTSNTQYNIARYSVYSLDGANYLVQRFGLEPTYTTKNGWVLAADLDYYFNRGLTPGFNQSVPLLNSSISKLFWARRAEVKLSGFDLLNQNVSLTRNIEQNYIEDVRTQILKGYFLLGFIYHLNKTPNGKGVKQKAGKARK